MIPSLASAPVLARWLGVTDKAVRELAKTGVAGGIFELALQPDSSSDKC